MSEREIAVKANHVFLIRNPTTRDIRRSSIDYMKRVIVTYQKNIRAIPATTYGASLVVAFHFLEHGVYRQSTFIV